MHQSFFHEMLSRIKTIAVTCLQFGDTGKGKIVDLLASWADIIARGTGGANAGHSILENQVSSIFHLIPCGILYDSRGKVNIIGSGVAVDPRVLCEELDMLSERKLSCHHLRISLNAKLTLPTQVVRDRLSESKESAGKIGTTGRGIGPTYGDHVLRVGLIVNDLLNRDVLAEKVKANIAFTKRITDSYDPLLVREIMAHPHLGSGSFYCAQNTFDADAIMEKYLAYGACIKQFIYDTDSFIRQNAGQKKILLEGAQGTLLDVDHGTRPFVTSSNCTVDGLAKGVGLNRSQVDLSLGVLKGFYMSRVGEGPFPTELGGEASAQWCRSSNREKEKEVVKYALATVNNQDEFRQGIALRMAGNEYGATTGRPRRIGWLDLPLLRYALQWSGPDAVLTKLDVLNDCDAVKVCTYYRYMGSEYHFGDNKLSSRDLISVAIPVTEVLGCCIPQYTVFPGWKKSLAGIASLKDLPEELKNILDFVAVQAGINPRIISIGPDRQETIFV